MLTRIPRWLPLVACVWFLGTSPAAAQALVVPGYQTVVGPSGYQYQVPASWQRLPDPPQQQMGDQSLSIDGGAVSPDGSEHVHVETGSGLGITRAKLADALAAYLGLGRGGGDTVDQPPLKALGGPDPVQVPKADAALAGAATYTDPNGTARVVVGRMAVRGDTAYLQVLDVTQDFYDSDPAFLIIESSFLLTPP